MENMSTFVCPHCNEKIDIFTGLGVEKAAKDFNVEILGKIPLDTNIVKSGDTGRSLLKEFDQSASVKEFNNIVNKILTKFNN